MNLTPRQLILPIIAIGVLALTLQQTIAALHASGSWRPRLRAVRLRTEDPYSRVDDVLGQNHPQLTTSQLRNPFAFGGVRGAIPGSTSTQPRNPRHSVPPPAPKPSLTSIIFDSDPQATVRYDGHDFSVHVNSLFADFRVQSITATNVVLDRNGQRIVLTLRPKGD